MAFYDLSKQQRTNLVAKINNDILVELKSSGLKKTLPYFEDEDTNIRKGAYLSVGKIYFAN